MLEKWTGEVVGTMHIHGITAKKLAGKMNVNEKYLSAILNGKKKPKDAEFRTRAALNDLLHEGDEDAEVEAN